MCTEIAYHGFQATTEIHPHIFGPIRQLFPKAALPEVVLKAGAKRHFPDTTSNLGSSNYPSLICSCLNSPQF